MNSPHVMQNSLPDFTLWNRIGEKRVPLDFYLEITARCNNNCSHCYINLPPNDLKAKEKELSLFEINQIADQAVELGALWCLVTGGEPLLRKDFSEIYLSLKRKGLLVSVFTNACLITQAHIDLFKKYPPRDIEVTVYGVSQETYERVTRQPGSYKAFRRGLDLLLNNGIKVRLKAVVTRSNFQELPQIAEFCRERTMDYFRFDPLLNFRYDQDSVRNEEIRCERLTPEEIVAIEQADEDRADSLADHCDHFIFPEHSGEVCNHLFHCGAGNESFIVSYDGIFRLCGDLWHPDTTLDLRTHSLKEAWSELVPQVRELRSDSADYLNQCRVCPIVNLCLWCPARAYLETGDMDGFSDYFCAVAHARADAIQKRIKIGGQGSIS